MNAAVLCPGPSLEKLSAPPKADLTIAVNRAALRLPCDIWAANDYPIIRKNAGAVVGCPKVMTRRQTWADVSRRCHLPLGGLIEDFIGDCPSALLIKTLPCAMLYAARQGATRIELFGCDWAGKKDFDGIEAGENRSDERWEKEREDTTALIEWLAQHGTEVVNGLN